MVDDTKQFSRRIRLRAHFSKPDLPNDNNTIINQSSYEHDESVTPNTLNISNHSQHSQFLSITQYTDHDERYRQFTPKSDWVPPKQSKVLETFIENVENDIASFQPERTHHNNISKCEKMALIALKNRTDIIIKPADKGSSVVVMDRDQYISEAERQLNDNTYYQLLDHDPTTEFATQVAETVNKMHDKGYITDKNMEYLLVEKPRAGRFYLLSKIHKSRNPGRPIVSANGHPTERILHLYIFILNHMYVIFLHFYKIPQII